MTTPLKAARQARGWTQERLLSELRALGVSLPAASLKTQLSRWENGHRTPDTYYRGLFRRVYGLTDDELGFGSADPMSMSELQISVPPTALPQLVSGLTQVLAQLAAVDALVGPFHVRTSAREQARLVSRLLIGAAAADRSSVLPLAVRFAEFNGWLCQDAGDLPRAAQWTDRALEYSTELGREDLMSYVLMRKSSIATDIGDLSLGLGLANAALRRRTLAPRMRAVALRQRAQTQSQLGDVDAAVRDLNSARAEVDQFHAGDADEPDDELVSYCGSAYIEMEAAACQVTLGESQLAVASFERSLAAWPTGQQERDRGLCLARLATAHAVANDLDAAAEVGVEAFAALSGSSSRRTLDQLHVVRRAMRPARDNPTVRAFNEAFDNYYLSQEGSTGWT